MVKTEQSDLKKKPSGTKAKTCLCPKTIKMIHRSESAHPHQNIISHRHAKEQLTVGACPTVQMEKEFLPSTLDQHLNLNLF